MSKNSLHSTIESCEKLLAAAAEPRGLPFMEALGLELAAEVERLKTLSGRRSALRDELKQSTRQLQSSQGRGTALVRRMQWLARSWYDDGKTLKEFGIKPRARRKARARPGGRKVEAPRNPTAR
jgi:hypothetical protein